ncbi:sensor histidine kinase [Spirosoma rigui]|uniref:sensor histidine kinase n=1 Tax=Spirosoma rigui TaxID=564064 RepID=UPI0009B18C9C|nr:HAMP domain-containing sensor histidine kinase [Spirosoma rigui]
MDTTVDDQPTPFVDLATYLLARRETILANWRTACEHDSNLRAPSDLSRAEFNDNIPSMFNGLDCYLRGEPLAEDIRQQAAQHGLHRWHKGYSLNELLHELKCLNQTLNHELRTYWTLNTTVGSEQIAAAYDCINWFRDQTIDGSVEQYSTLQQLEATSRVYTLQQAMDGLNDLARQRGDLLRTTSHDLRSSFGVIQGATDLLGLASDSPDEREKSIEMLSRNLNAVREMILQLMDLARLEAGQEVAKLREVDVSRLIREQLIPYQQMADERGLVLLIDGPPDLLVMSDPILIQRILQNLILNAVRHTHNGFVSVSWSRENDSRWFLSIQDTGPGLSDQRSYSIMNALAPMPDTNAVLHREEPQAPTATPAVSGAQPGEGIGLSIVKHLCELLRASMDIESQAGVGTLFRIRLPIR